jgi:hypothetical protein
MNVSFLSLHRPPSPRRSVHRRYRRQHIIGLMFQFFLPLWLIQWLYQSHSQTSRIPHHHLRWPRNTMNVAHNYTQNVLEMKLQNVENDSCKSFDIIPKATNVTKLYGQEEMWYPPPSSSTYWDRFKNLSTTMQHDQFFLSRSQRIRFYMGSDWYYPPCPIDGTHGGHDNRIQVHPPLYRVPHTTEIVENNNESIGTANELPILPASRWTFVFSMQSIDDTIHGPVEAVNVTIAPPHFHHTDIAVDRILLLEGRAIGASLTPDSRDQWHNTAPQVWKRCQQNHSRYSLQAYCDDILHSMLYRVPYELLSSSFQHHEDQKLNKSSATPSSIPFLVQFGDNLEGNGGIPRDGVSGSQLTTNEMQLYLPRFQKARRFFIGTDDHFAFTGIPTSPHIVINAATGKFCRVLNVASGPPGTKGWTALVPYGGVNYQPKPILWKLEIERHYGLISKVDREDVDWDLKMDMAVFRGTLTGLSLKTGKDANDDLTLPLVHHNNSCSDLLRCMFVRQHNRNRGYEYESAIQAETTNRSHNILRRNSLVDAKLTNTFHRIPDTIVEQWNLMATRRLHLRELLRYKGIIVIPGNDVASSLKWALYSKSVVLMPPIPSSKMLSSRSTTNRWNDPTIAVSWAMEPFLQPWIHYIPIPLNGYNAIDKYRLTCRKNHGSEGQMIINGESDEKQDWFYRTIVEERVQWMIDHPKESQAIAANGREWIRRLLDPIEENSVQKELIRRYLQHIQLVVKEKKSNKF